MTSFSRACVQSASPRRVRSVSRCRNSQRALKGEGEGDLGAPIPLPFPFERLPLRLLSKDLVRRMQELQSILKCCKALSIDLIAILCWVTSITKQSYIILDIYSVNILYQLTLMLCSSRIAGYIICPYYSG